jgi:FAD/FMN-containing dehydrogenase
MAYTATIDDGPPLIVRCGDRIDTTAAITSHAAGGCTWADVFGLAVSSGFISSTGVRGLTSGGGIGYLARRYGFTIDSLPSVDIVLADGRFVRPPNAITATVPGRA